MGSIRTTVRVATMDFELKFLVCPCVALTVAVPTLLIVTALPETLATLSLLTPGIASIAKVKLPEGESVFVEVGLVKLKP